MQLVHHGEHPGQSSIVFLPIIDMDPGNLSCIYSTLNFVSNHANQYNVTPILTFDQSLWWKAMSIITNEKSNSSFSKIIFRLGPFHTEMSFLGSIGHLMKGSGLEELLELIYSDNAVGHIVSGKAVSRAWRGHSLVQSALYALVMSHTYNLPLPITEDRDNDLDLVYLEPGEDPQQHLDVNEDLKEIKIMLEKLLKNEMTIDEASSSDLVSKLSNTLDNEINSYCKSRTATLWLQYLKMVDILHAFIKAERIDDWSLHLQTCEAMLPYLASSGHNLYTKSLRLYLQHMHELEENKNNSDVFKAFKDGLHVIRRTNRFWAGISTDLAIEQVLMRSIKTTGGLTKGRGLTETQRLVWLLSMPYAADINDAMQTLTGVRYTSTEQHKDITIARVHRDMNDILKLLNFLECRNPFMEDSGLRNITNGVMANAAVNTDKALSVGNSILKQMTGQKIGEYKFQKKNQVTLINIKHVETVKNNQMIDQQLLFQRLLIVAKGFTHDISSIFNYELSVYPTAMFETPGIFRKANKSALADAILKSITMSDTLPTENSVQYVIDGGSLQHQIPWKRGMKYSEIFKLYTEYIRKCLMAISQVLQPRI